MTALPGSAQLLDPNGEPYGPLNPFPVSMVSTDQLLTVTVPAGTAVGDVLHFTGTADTTVKSQADSAHAGTMPAHAICEVLLSATSAQVRVGGLSHAKSGLTPGASYYVSRTTAGAITSSLAGFVAGDVVQLVGVAIDATTLLLVFGDDLVLEQQGQVPFVGSNGQLTYDNSLLYDLASHQLETQNLLLNGNGSGFGAPFFSQLVVLNSDPAALLGAAVDLDDNSGGKKTSFTLSYGLAASSGGLGFLSESNPVAGQTPPLDLLALNSAGSLSLAAFQNLNAGDFGWVITAAGMLAVDRDNTYDLGITGHRPRTVRAGTSVIAPTLQATTILDLSTIAAANDAAHIAATTNVPATTFNQNPGTHNPSNAPAGFLQVNVGGASRYIPFYT